MEFCLCCGACFRKLLCTVIMDLWTWKEGNQSRIVLNYGVLSDPWFCGGRSMLGSQMWQRGQVLWNGYASSEPHNQNTWLLTLLYLEFFLPSRNSIAPARTDPSGYSFMCRTDKFSAQDRDGSRMWWVMKGGEKAAGWFPLTTFLVATDHMCSMLSCCELATCKTSKPSTHKVLRGYIKTLLQLGLARSTCWWIIITHKGVYSSM